MKGTEEYENMTRDELYEMAKDKEIPGKSNMNKEELIKALKKHDEEGSKSKRSQEEGGQREKETGRKSADSGE